MRRECLDRSGHGKWMSACLLAACVLLGTSRCLRADDDHRRDRDYDRRQRDRGTRVEVNVNVNAPPAYFVENRGPIHEGFAVPVMFDPSPGMMVPMAPPPLLQESPPDRCPEGDDIRWVPGYWGWDDDRHTYIWISGIWRNVPPGRQFIPGYWCQMQGQYQWVAGCWAPEKVEVIQYLPAPPPSLDPAEVGLPPQPYYVWVPGVWIWTGVEYLWRPGYWLAPRQDWVWVPDHYLWTPRGYVFVQGYWDYVLPRRGVLFAPVYVPPQPVSQPVVVYRPSVVVNVSLLIGSMFARPNYEHYYYGDYYDRSYFKSGIYPAVSFHNSRYGYDPCLAHDVARRPHDRDQYVQRMRDDYHFRRDNPDARPPRTYADLQRTAQRQDHNPRLTGLLQMAQSLDQTASRADAPFRLKPVQQERLNAVQQVVAQLRQYQDQRKNLETQDRGDRWQGATFAPSNRSARPRQLEPNQRNAQPSARSVPQNVQADRKGPTEVRLERSPLGSRSRNLIEALFKPTPAPPKASPPDRSVKPSENRGNRREPQE